MNRIQTHIQVLDYLEQDPTSPPPPFLIIKLFIRCLLVGVREGVGISLSTYKWKQIGVFFTRRIVYVYELFSTWNEPYNGIKNQGLYNFFAIIGTLVKFSKHFSHSCGLVLSADILQKVDSSVQTAKVSIFHRKSAENASLQWDPHLVKDIKMVEAVQRRASRIALGQRRQEMAYEERYNILNWSSLERRRMGWA